MREGYMENESTFGFYFNDNEGKTVDIQLSTSDGANSIVKEFEKFLKACGYISDGSLTIQRPNPTKLSVVESGQKRKDFDFSAIPNNNWLFGTQQIPALTSIDISAFNLASNPLEKVNQYPTMAPLTPEQVKSWSIPSPGTIGGAQVKF